jgi:hypothetical protein
MSAVKESRVKKDNDNKIVQDYLNELKQLKTITLNR